MINVPDRQGQSRKVNMCCPIVLAPIMGSGGGVAVCFSRQVLAPEVLSEALEGSDRVAHTKRGRIFHGDRGLGFGQVCGWVGQFENILGMTCLRFALGEKWRAVRVLIGASLDRAASPISRVQLMSVP